MIHSVRDKGFAYNNGWEPFTLLTTSHLMAKIINTNPFYPATARSLLVPAVVDLRCPISVKGVKIWR